jgi:protein required for attachment to host cells
MLIPHDALVLVADGRKFLLLRNIGDINQPNLVFEGSGEKESSPTRMQGSDAPGRSATYGMARTTVDQTDFHQLDEIEFARDVAELLNRLAEAEDFLKLIVVSPSRTLAELRRRLDQVAKGRIIAEVSKDLTNHPVAEIAEVLSRVD